MIEDKDKLLQMTNELNESLELEQVVLTFAKYLKDVIPFEQITYDNQEHNISYTHGDDALYQFQFNLQLQNHVLGTVSFAKGSFFKPEEINLIEDFLCYFINPIKNVITHDIAKKEAIHDPLTHLYNRNTLTSTMLREIKLSQRSSKPLSVIMCDIDDFKAINDNFGHLAGDEILRHVAAAIKQNIRDCDIAFRMGGEEFLILLSDTSQDGAKLLAERLRTEIAHSCVRHDVNEIHYTISLGLSTWQSGDNQDSLIKKADQAMYSSKQNGKNRTTIHA